MMDPKHRKAKLYFDVVTAIDLIEDFLGPINLTPLKKEMLKKLENE